MKLVIDILEERVSAAMAVVAGVEGCAAIVRPAADPKFGDYQANGVMGLAKKAKTNPRKLAEEVVEKLDLSDMCEPPEVAGPGFINLRLKADFLAGRLLEINKDAASLAVEKVDKPKTIVVDFSSPNIAKQMHVGHLRSTIIGDAICRMFDFLGHKVIRQNHVGDWGTQFGRVVLGLWHMCMAEKHMSNDRDCPVPYYRSELEELTEYAEDEAKLAAICGRICNRDEVDWREDKDTDHPDELPNGEEYFRPFLDALRERDLSELWPEFLTAYQYVNRLEESAAGMGLTVAVRKRDIETGRWKEERIPFESLSRHATAMVQNKDNRDNVQEEAAWQLIREISLADCETIYDLLNVKITDKHFDYQVVRGESFYRRMLSPLVKRLIRQGVARESDGAICIFPDDFKTADGRPLPFIIQKSDGAHLYATTDLAALRFRVSKLHARRIVYVTDKTQKLHFEMLFEVVGDPRVKWAGDDVDLDHVTFGSVLGEDGSPLKTRSGENVRLRELLDEAVQRARRVVEEKNPDLPDDKKAEIAKAVGIGAVKYADYSNNRTSDYVFNFDKMLAMEGNTAPYMQYAYARIKSIERKAESGEVDIETELAGLEELSLTEPAELNLAKYLIRYGEAIASAAGDYRPNYLTTYLYELSQKFSTFYTNCPVLKAEPEKRPSRLLLCDLTARTIRHGLTELLGISVVEQM